MQKHPNGVTRNPLSLGEYNLNIRLLLYKPENLNDPPYE